MLLSLLQEGTAGGCFQPGSVAQGALEPSASLSLVISNLALLMIALPKRCCLFHVFQLKLQH